MRNRIGTVFGVFLLFLLGAGPVVAAGLNGAAHSGALVAPAIHYDRLAAQAAAGSAVSNADNAWMLVSAVLVLLMTGPGLALFYGGMVRKKNVLGTMMQSFAMMAVITVIWAFGRIQPGLWRREAALSGACTISFCTAWVCARIPHYSSTIPAQTYMIYQLMFAIITPALITGAFAERHEVQRACSCSSRYGRSLFTARWRIWCGAKAGC